MDPTPIAVKPVLNSSNVYTPNELAFILELINIVTMSELALTPRSSKNFCRPSYSMFFVVESLYLSNVCYNLAGVVEVITWAVSP